MQKFTNVADIGDLNAAVAEALEIKKNKFAYTELGRNKTLLMIFFRRLLLRRFASLTRVVIPITASSFRGFSASHTIKLSTTSAPANSRSW